MGYLSWFCVSKTDVGTVRRVNEDSYLDGSSVGLWCVADGMGGHARGDMASQLIIQRLSILTEQSVSPLNLSQISACIKSVNTSLVEMSKKHGAIVGSTVAILFVDGAKIHCIWAGDSRIYRIRERHIHRLTRDHSQVEDMVAAGLISSLEAETHPKANIITRAVGAHDELLLDIASYDLEKKDRFLLCSDGLNKVMSDAELERHLLDTSFNSAAEELINKAIERKAKDNVTVIVVQHKNCRENNLDQTLSLDATLPLTQR